MARLAAAPAADPVALQRRKKRMRSSEDARLNKGLGPQNDHNKRRISSGCLAQKPFESDTRVEVEEIDRSGVLQRKWTQDSDESMALVYSIDGSNRLKSFNLSQIKRTLSDSFLPVGFPHSVTSDYLTYQTYDSLQAFFSTISSLLSSRALLEGLGVGNAESSATYALILTIFRDTISRLATIAFAHGAGLTIEPECKRFRFLADVFNDTAFFLDLLSPALPSFIKILVLCTSSALRAMCGVAAGSSKAALSSHFAKQNNMAELNAKEASQETAVGLIGLLIGTLIVQIFQDRHTVFWLMILLVLAHLYMNYCAVRSVNLTVLNRQRMTLLYQSFLRSGRLLTPAAIGEMESILLWTPIVHNRYDKPAARVSFAKCYKDLVSSRGREVMTRGEKFIVWIHEGNGNDLYEIRIMLKDEAEHVDALKAWTVAMDKAWLLDRKCALNDLLYSAARLANYFEPHTKTLEESEIAASQNRLGSGCGDQFISELQDLGWNIGAAAFETGTPVRLRVIATDKKIN
ncbi:hypothetical protein Cpir12675_003950 [Ceratocystis pirilliformis]|uniref:Protein root UVB sensitive/RUS domain-containing protein n=1 Tax=Ceratocystis pirilliformis TaxID=259994 RepID=A0ABR3Z0V5_9PEZI